VLLVAALLGGIAISGVLLGLRGLAGIDVTRSVPRIATAGRPLPVTLEISNRGRAYRGLVLVDDRFCGDGAAFARSVRPGRSTRFRGLRYGCRRGVYEGGPAAIETGFPFGIVRARKQVTIASPLVVYPRTFDVSTRLPAGGGALPAAAPFGDVSSVRDYHAGDPLRHIHWRTVARRGQLAVREFDEERRARMSIVAIVPEDRDLADAIASVATSLALGALREAGEVTLLTPGGAVHERSADAVLEWGARLAAGVLEIPDTRHTVCVRPADDGSSALVVIAGGERIAELRPEEVEAWFARGCPVS
jgi:uncharacterized protein (DUF58 family)